MAIILVYVQTLFTLLVYVQTLLLLHYELLMRLLKSCCYFVFVLDFLTKEPPTKNNLKVNNNIIVYIILTCVYCATFFTERSSDIYTS